MAVVRKKGEQTKEKKKDLGDYLRDNCILAMPLYRTSVKNDWYIAITWRNTYKYDKQEGRGDERGDDRKSRDGERDCSTYITSHSRPTSQFYLEFGHVSFWVKFARRESFYLFGALVVWVSARRHFIETNCYRDSAPFLHIFFSFSQDPYTQRKGMQLSLPRQDCHTPFFPEVIVLPPRESSMTLAHVTTSKDVYPDKFARRMTRT